ncbi:MAG TPA: hypothetical protein VGR00_06200, partial [Thermoanaerobaculia bacterium]|nr:hypothetical protein [Thermoanaerobaculia bacterium]
MPAPSFAEPTPSLSRSRARTLVGVAAGALLLAASLRLFSATETGSGWAWVLYGAALAVFVAAFRQRRGAGAGGRRVHGAELAALGIVLIAGAVLRFHRLTTEPYGVWFDEAQNTLVAKQILADPSYRPVFVAGFSQMPALPFYYDALFVALLGPKVLAVRLGATLVGLAALVATWLVGRQLFGPAAGI